MPHHDQLREIEERLQHEDPAFADAMARGTHDSPAPRTRRYGPAWLWLVVGLVALGFGIAMGHGLLIAAGLVAAGAAGQLFDPERRGRTRGRDRTHERPHDRGPDRSGHRPAS